MTVCNVCTLNLRQANYILQRDDAVRLRVNDNLEAVGRAHGAVFGTARPASTMVVVKALLDDRWKVEIEAEAIVGEAR